MIRPDIIQVFWKTYHHLLKYWTPSHWLVKCPLQWVPLPSSQLQPHHPHLPLRSPLKPPCPQTTISSEPSTKKLIPVLPGVLVPWWLTWIPIKGLVGKYFSYHPCEDSSCYLALEDHSKYSRNSPIILERSSICNNKNNWADFKMVRVADHLHLWVRNSFLLWFFGGERRVGKLSSWLMN